MCNCNFRNNCQNRCPKPCPPKPCTERKMCCFKVERVRPCPPINCCNAYPEPYMDECDDDIICCFD